MGKSTRVDFLNGIRNHHGFQTGIGKCICINLCDGACKVDGFQSGAVVEGAYSDDYNALFKGYFS